MKATTAVRLALAGTRADAVRVVLTACSAALATFALLAALTVLAIRTPPDTGSRFAPWSEQYGSALLREPGLRPGVAIALILLMVPVLALAGQCTRLGAPARDRRLAAIRLAGATPRQTTAIALAETGLAAVTGTAVAFVGYLVAHEVLHRPGPDGTLALPTDVLPSVPVLVAAGLGLPLLAMLAAVVVLRRVTISPFGLVRRQGRNRAPWPWPGILIVLGVLLFGAFGPLQRAEFKLPDWIGRIPGWLVVIPLFGGAFLASIGVVLGAGWISYTTGRLLRRFARRPAPLLAGSRLMADPWAGSRNLAALLACVLFAAGAAGVRSWFTTQEAAQAEANRLAAGPGPSDIGPGDSFHLQTMDLVNLAVLVALVIAAGGLVVAIVEGIVTSRRTYAALVATGVPRPVLGRAILWQSLAPAVPAILLAVTVGVLLPRSLQSEARTGGSSWEVCDASQALCEDPVTRAQYTRIVEEPAIIRSIPVPFDELALAVGVGLAAVLATVAIGLVFLRSSTDLEELRVG
ncbi:ABC transporter permease [Plantactinospora sp. S1510]|uniref:ABC transporter permease n=1 Tax=Plantactinospora alkalitolerans TaxID=2789879 RepID=A0ABS0GNN0_9ACTN|nr:FtsX-like permease family protein [Plantactinospora alkalitolerans]MBF9127795.1 ABC transporter permease [Plantactinospora alkalitolerans]